MNRAYKGKDVCDRTRDFALRIIKAYQALEHTSAGRVLGKQLLRAGTSIGANVAEAQSGQSTADFIAKMSIALKEARETRYWLTLVAGSELLPLQRVTPLLGETEEIIKILFSIIQNTRRNSQ